MLQSPRRFVAQIKVKCFKVWAADGRVRALGRGRLRRLKGLAAGIAHFKFLRAAMLSRFATLSRQRRLISQCPRRMRFREASEFLVPFHQEIIDQDVRAEGKRGGCQEGDRKQLNEGHLLYSGSRRVGYLNSA